MAINYHLTEHVETDLRDIWRYIAEDNPAAADRVEAALYDAFEKLARNPYMGHIRSDITSQPVRFWGGVYSYQIIYDPEPVPLRILRILSGWRAIDDHLGDGLF